VKRTTNLLAKLPVETFERKDKQTDRHADHNTSQFASLLGAEFQCLKS